MTVFTRKFITVFTLLMLGVTALPSAPAVAAVDCSVPFGPGVNLYECGLGDAFLNFSNLAGANLSRTDLTFANIVGTNLQGANLSRADLSQAFMRGANLRNANLSRANLTNAFLFEADLRGANLDRVIWDNTTCPDGSNSDDNGDRCFP